MAIPAYCFSIFGSIFGALFCLLIKKFILECDTVWQSMRKFLQAVWSVSTFPRMDKEKFLSWKLHVDMVWIFYTFSLDLNFELKFSENLAALNFLREKVQLLSSPNDIYISIYIYTHSLTLNYHLQYAKRFSNIIAR